MTHAQIEDAFRRIFAFHVLIWYERAWETLKELSFGADRMPGISIVYDVRKNDLLDGVNYNEVGDEVWTKYGNENVLPRAGILYIFQG